MTRRTGSLFDLYPVACSNQYAGEIPAFSVVVVTGNEMIDGQLVLKVDRPSNSWSEHLAITWPMAIGDGGKGQCAISGLVQAAVNSSSPADLIAMGPAVNSFQLEEHSPGFRNHGVVENTNSPKRAWVRFETAHNIKGEMDEVIASGETKTMNVFTGSGTGTDSGFDVEVSGEYIDADHEIPDGAKVAATLINGEYYVTIMKGCPDES